MLIRYNNMKKINTLLALLSALLLLGACEKDGDKFYLSSPVESDLIASTNAVVLTEATAKLYALSLAWSDQTLQISDPRYQVTSGIQTTVQVSRSEDFSGNIIESTENGVSKSYTVAALNIIAYKLDAPAEEAAPLYFRLAGSNGSNIAPVYSNTVAVTVTPYPIDMHYASIINKSSGQDSGQDFYSANADGQYSGFFGAAAWEGIYVQEADGTTWHTAQSGGVGTPFLLTTDAAEGTWDMWFPGQSGCYFVNVNTTQKQWNALLMPELNVSGIDGISMQYSRADNQWKGVFTGTEGTNINIQLQGTGKFYNNTSVSGSDNAIDDTKAKDTPFAFGGTAGQLTFSTGEAATAGNITVSVPATGECTLVIDLNNPEQWTVSVEAGAAEPEPEAAPYIYFPGIGPAVNGAWAYDHKIAIYNEDELKYAGVVNVDSEWGDYAISTTDYWDESQLYTLVSDDATSTAENGVLFQGNGKNIPAPVDGLYLFEVSLKEPMSYKSNAVNNVYCYLGIDGEGLVALQAGETAGTYTGSITLGQDSQWGLKFVINDWTGSYGGYDGTLYYGANDGIKPVEAGTYNVTVDLINGTYTINNQ